MCTPCQVFYVSAAVEGSWVPGEVRTFYLWCVHANAAGGRIRWGISLSLSQAPPLITSRSSSLSFSVRCGCTCCLQRARALQAPGCVGASDQRARPRPLPLLYLPADSSRLYCTSPQAQAPPCTLLLTRRYIPFRAGNAGLVVQRFENQDSQQHGRVAVHVLNAAGRAVPPWTPAFRFGVQVGPY